MLKGSWITFMKSSRTSSVAAHQRRNDMSYTHCGRRTEFYGDVTFGHSMVEAGALQNVHHSHIEIIHPRRSITGGAIFNTSIPVPKIR